MKVEFLRAWDDNTWDTEIIDLPEFQQCGDTPDAGMVDWANNNLATQAQYRKVVLFAVYAIPDEEVP